MASQDVARVPPLSLEESSEGMLVRRIRVSPPDVVFVKGILEASEGLAAMFADAGGDLAIAAPHGRGAELAEILEDLVDEIGAVVVEGDTPALCARGEASCGAARVDG